MNAFDPVSARNALVERREQLEAAARQSAVLGDVQHLLREVDTALERIERGSYGLCEVCHDPIEADRLAADPLVRFCLDHLSDGEQRALERDIALAAKVQRQLLPCCATPTTGWTIAHRYEPLGAVSGDYIDVLPEREGAVCFAIGDISGKGIAASLLMAHLSATVRALGALGLAPGELLGRVNAVFCESVLPAHYATITIGCAMADGTVALASAGHPPALLVRRGAGDGSIERITATGIPAGLFCSSDWGTVEYRLGRGDSLVLYTDGLIEGKNADGEEHGIARLEAAVLAHAGGSPDELAAAAVRAFDGFRGRVPRGDDVAVLVLRRTA